MRRDISWRLQESIPLPQARNRALPTMPIGYRVEVSRIRFPFKDPVLAAPLPPEGLLTLINPHKGLLKGISLKPLLSGETH